MIVEGNLASLNHCGCSRGRAQVILLELMMMMVSLRPTSLYTPPRVCSDGYYVRITRDRDPHLTAHSAMSVMRTSLRMGLTLHGHNEVL